MLVRALVVAASAATALLITTAAAQASVQPKEHDPVFDNTTASVGVLVTKLSHADATSRLRSSNITWSSSGGCSDRYNSTCTSFSQVNLATIQGIQTLKSASGCGINVTGGTEVGHASGTYSHWNGYKLDTSLNSCLNGYIQGNFAYIGGSKWRSGAGNIYYLEGNHWDITYYNCGGC
ncbi:MAG: hypothetical protein GEV28_22215 [Actinophytocola sp.]|uniref:hypothetical protein n=1 Tax=Actinophytocola sp. TaxID=1872138 RepID=UPI00132C754A|nr:hypothetical protein [Actinophytocola sp.]MPZ82960.1 hypothetical protein [Actinophytocola sp.]